MVSTRKKDNLFRRSKFPDRLHACEIRRLTGILVTLAKSKPLFQSRTSPNRDLTPFRMLDGIVRKETLSLKLSDVPRVGQGLSLSAAPQLASSVLRVLLVGDREEDFYLIREILEHNRGATPAPLDHAANIGKARAMLHGADYGLVLFVHEVGDAAVGLLSEFLVTRGAIPFILLTENAAEKDVAEIVRAGALDAPAPGGGETGLRFAMLRSLGRHELSLARLAEDPSAFPAAESPLDMESRADEILESAVPPLKQPGQSSGSGHEIIEIEEFDANDIDFARELFQRTSAVPGSKGLDACRA